MQIRICTLVAVSYSIVANASRHTFLSSGVLNTFPTTDFVTDALGSMDDEVDALSIDGPSALVSLNQSTLGGLTLPLTPPQPNQTLLAPAANLSRSPVHSKRVEWDSAQIQGLVYHPRHRSHIIRRWHRRWHRPRDCGDACKGLIDYEMALHETSGSLVVFWFLFVIPVLIWLLGTTAQHFFVPSLLDWSKRLGMQPEIAGATLLALGVSAPDIFSAVLAAEAQDLPLALSEILGANMFNLCINGGMVILAAAYVLGPQPGEEAQKATERAAKAQNARLVIPIGMLVVTICSLGVILFWGHFTMLKALLLPGIYCVYVTLLSIRSKVADGSQCVEEETDESHEIGMGEGSGGGADSAAGMPPPSLQGLAAPKDMSPLGIVFWILALPFYMVRWASIPPADGIWDRQRRIASACSPFAMILIFMMAMPEVDSVLGRQGFAVLLVIGALLSAGVYANSSNGPDLPWFYPALTLLAGVSSVFWLGGVANELTALIEGIGFVLKVPRLRLGFILIAWGNAAADSLTIYAMARRGRLRTAFNAVFSNPLVADWLGLGATLLIVVRNAGGAPAKLWENGCPPELRLPLAVCLTGLLGAASLHGARLACGGGGAQKSAKMWAGLLVAWYFVFLVVIFGVSGIATPAPGGEA